LEELPHRGQHLTQQIVAEIGFIQRFLGRTRDLVQPRPGIDRQGPPSRFFQILVPGHDEEPVAKALIAVVRELGQLLDQGGEDFLHQVQGVGVLQTYAAGPGEDQWQLKAYQPRPGRRIVGLLELLQESGGSRVHSEPQGDSDT
jgi:hypothetical protein